MTIQSKSSVLVIDNLFVKYGEASIVSGLSFSVRPGEITLLSGKNGSGKTTILRSIAGLKKPFGGDIRMCGESLSGKSVKEIRKTGVVSTLQGGRVFRNLTVAENLQLVCIRNTPLEGLLIRFDIQLPLRKKAGFLSGGQRQQLSLLLALVQKAKLYLLDEPLAGLSNAQVDLAIENIKTRIEETGAAALIVEHRLEKLLAVVSGRYDLDQNHYHRV